MIKPKFNQSFVKGMLDARQDTIDVAVINELKLIGEQFVNDARDFGSYRDQTGNLRSSIGYVILKKGRKVAENFKLADRGTERTRGKQVAQDFTKKLMAQFSSFDYVLIVVAGMDYASAVEIRGRDVLTGASIIAKKSLRGVPTRIKKLLNKRTRR